MKIYILINVLVLGLLFSCQTIDEKKSDQDLLTNQSKQDEIPARGEKPKDLTEYGSTNTYVPKDLEECFIEFDKMFTTNFIETFKKSDSVLDYHFSLGMWMRNEWGLWRGSPLKGYLLKCGFWLPDDMSNAILEQYKLYLNNMPLTLKILPDWKEKIEEEFSTIDKEKRIKMNLDKIDWKETEKRGNITVTNIEGS